MRPTNNRPAVLIEDWLPFEAIGVESVRERGYPTPFPAPYRLHVWWARRPLMISRAAILAGVLPQWSANWPVHLLEHFPDEASYRDWFVRFLGILGDPVEGRKELERATELGITLGSRAYGGAPRAFTVSPAPENLQLLGDLLEHTWGTREVAVLDPTAGGGSIPLESLRYGFTTYANELNPVASVVLEATLRYPAQYGIELADDIQRWGSEWARRVQERLSPFFQNQPNDYKPSFLWARTVACPATGKPVPLSPNWWLRKGSNPVVAKLIAEPDNDVPRFIIQRGDAIDFDPDEGTVSRGVGRSPWTGEAIDGDYIKAEAQAGRMGQMLYAIANKKPGTPDFRAPTRADLEAAARAQAALAENLPRWEAMGLVPNEPIPQGNKTSEPYRYGIYRWTDMYAPRQFLSMAVFIETLHDMAVGIREEMSAERAAAVETYLGLAIDKAADYNAILATWENSRGTVKHVFKRHDFAFSWSYGEFDASADLLTWAVAQVCDAYRGLTELTAPAQYDLWNDNLALPIERLTITQGSGADITALADGSVHNITFDPPYYDNVMYAELADFFYVWMKRSVGHIYPEWFADHLTNKDDEAVANPARFEGLKKKKQLAEQDYEHKMEAIFRECRRVLRDDGVLTIMFTHKRVEAWDTLASALIRAGFSVETSWPVHTESEHSLHQAKKNAAASTILLACRKRDAAGAPAWWDDIKGQVRRVARDKAQEFAAQGVSGVDLYISTFGPALSVISANWPVYSSEVDEKTGQPVPLRPEVALDLAREEVIALRKQGLLLGRDIEFDPITDWYLMAWDAFQAAQFPYDEARKLAIALGVDLDGDIRGSKRLVGKKGSYVVMQTPRDRRKKGMVDPDAETFDAYVDAVHTALLVLQEDGTPACDIFLRNSGLRNDGTFKECVRAMINAIPRTKIKGNWVRVEADLLERLRANFFADIEPPQEEEPPQVEQQMEMDLGGQPDDEEFDEEDEEYGE